MQIYLFINYLRPSLTVILAEGKYSINFAPALQVMNIDDEIQ